MSAQRDITRECETRTDRRCDISTIVVRGGSVACTAHDPLAVAMVCAALNPEVIEEVGA